jgi:hypothetical protein
MTGIFTEKPINRADCMEMVGQGKNPTECLEATLLAGELGMRTGATDIVEHWLR